MTKVLFICTIPGRAYVKKNTQRVVRGRRVIYSPNFLAWERGALATLRRAYRGLPSEGNLEARFSFYFANRQAESDLSNLIEGPQDALQKAGVIANDKQIITLHARKFFGAEPRVEIELLGFSGGDDAL